MFITPNRFIISLAEVILIFLGTFSVANSAECTTSSGSKCTVTCSAGTATATCSDSSKNCSTSCSDSSGNLEIDLIRSIQIVTNGRLDEYDTRSFVRNELDIRRLFEGRGRGEYRTYGGTIYIDIDPPRY